MYSRFRHNVGIQAVAKVDRVDVITKQLSVNRS